ncbi:MAG: hypothetical protein GKB99_02375 [Methanocellales archaeon]|nr:hypothetical protein [Methanocellales archaeon]
MAKRTVRYLNKNIRQSIIDDVKRIAQYHNDTQVGGFFGIPRQVFCYIDFLGWIAFGYIDNNGKPRNTKCSEEYIRKYFPDNYKDYAELIYAMWRHGTVHSYEPYTFYLENRNSPPKKIKILWQSNNDDTSSHRAANMKFFPLERKRSTLRLNINICQLVDDLLKSLDNLIVDIKRNRSLKIECEKRLNEYSFPRKLTKVRGTKRQNDIKKQIELAWENRSETINKNGEPVITN